MSTITRPQADKLIGDIADRCRDHDFSPLEGKLRMFIGHPDAPIMAKILRSAVLNWNKTKNK